MFTKEAALFQNQDFSDKVFDESVVCSEHSAYIAGKFSIFVEVVMTSLRSHKDQFSHSVQVSSEPWLPQKFV